MQALANSPAKLDDPFDSIGWQKRMTVNFVGLLPDTVYTARTLNEPDDGPW